MPLLAALATFLSASSASSVVKRNAGRDYSDGPLAASLTGSGRFFTLVKLATDRGGVSCCALPPPSFAATQDCQYFADNTARARRAKLSDRKP